LTHTLRVGHRHGRRVWRDRADRGHHGSGLKTSSRGKSASAQPTRAAHPTTTLQNRLVLFLVGVHADNRAGHGCTSGKKGSTSAENAPARHHARFDQGWPVRSHHIPASGVKGGELAIQRTGVGTPAINERSPPPSSAAPYRASVPGASGRFKYACYSVPINLGHLPPHPCSGQGQRRCSSRPWVRACSELHPYPPCLALLDCPDHAEAPDQQRPQCAWVACHQW
jgi:hypothetical protein